MSQHTEHACGTSAQSKPPLDIEALRTKLKSGLDKRHAKEDAIREKASEAERMAADAAAAIVKVFEGQVRHVDAAPIAEGYLVRVDSVPLIRIKVPEFYEPHLATSVTITNPNTRGGMSICCHGIDVVVRYAIKYATE